MLVGFKKINFAYILDMHSKIKHLTKYIPRQKSNSISTPFPNSCHEMAVLPLLTLVLIQTSQPLRWDIKGPFPLQQGLGLLDLPSSSYFSL